MMNNNPNNLLSPVEQDNVASDFGEFWREIGQSMPLTDRTQAENVWKWAFIWYVLNYAEQRKSE